MKTGMQARRRAGFTLIETIVTVGLLAVLAAFVIPTVIQKAGAGDPVKVQNDLTSIRTSLETYASDTKSGFPNQLYELTTKPTTSFHSIDSTTALTDGQVASWNGPYLAVTTDAIPTDSIATGYTAYIKNFIERYDVANDAGEFAGGTGAFSATSTLFAAIHVVGLTAAQAATVNSLVDGTNDVNVTTPGPTLGANITGRFRFGAPNVNGVVDAYFMADPITKQ